MNFEDLDRRRRAVQAEAAEASMNHVVYILENPRISPQEKHRRLSSVTASSDREREILQAARASVG